MKITKPLASSLPLEDALDQALERPGDFFPSRIAFAAAKRSDTLLRAIRTALTRDWRVAPSETVQVPKWGGATRPAVDISLRDRLVLDALIKHVRSEIPEGLINWSPRGEERARVDAALTAGGPAYILATDVTSFYEYVDHDVLIDELLDLTADEEAVIALGDLLTGLAGRPRGLPQGPTSIGALADVYLSIVDRRLLRDGLRIARYTDDYRIAAESWVDGQKAQIRLEKYLREVGLVINPAKTHSPRREDYETWSADRPEWATAIETAIANLPREVGANDGVAFANEYSGAVVLPEGLDAATLLGPVEADLSRIFHEPGFWGTPSNVRDSRRLKLALSVLRSFRSPAAVEHLPVLLRHFPHLAMETSLYLRNLVDTEHSEAAVAAIDNAIAEGEALFDWQLGWMLHALVPANEFLPARLVALATAELFRTDAPWFVRGRAAAVLATERKLPLGRDLARWIDEAPPATKADFLAAASLHVEDEETLALVNAVAEPGLREIQDAVGALDRSWL